MTTSPTLALTSGPAASAVELRDRELQVLSELAQQGDARVAFQGLRRRLGLHPQALVRTLRSLESAGYIRRDPDGYGLAPAGADAMFGRVAAPARPALRPVFVAVLPPHVTPQRLVERLAHRWFQGLRWYGLRSTEREQVLTWLTDEHGATVQLRVTEGMLGLEVEAPDTAPAIGLVGPLLEGIAAFYAAPQRVPLPGPPEAPRPAG